jgi:hypothetical protein
VADCLNGIKDRPFLVEADAAAVIGSSPAGVAFALHYQPTARAAEAAAAKLPGATTARIDNVVVDWSGNPPTTPGGFPPRLSAADLAAIRTCLLAS